MKQALDPACRIAALRARRRLTQAELGRQIGVAASTVRAWESGMTVPNPTHLAMLAAALNCRRQDLYPDA